MIDTSIKISDILCRYREFNWHDVYKNILFQINKVLFSRAKPIVSLFASNTFQLSSLQRLGSLFARLLTIILVFESCTYLVYGWIYWSNVALIHYRCFLIIQQSDISHFSKCCDDKGIWHVFINHLTDIPISFIRKVVFVLLLECRFRVFFCLNS